MFYRYNADSLAYEVCDNRGRVICETLTEEEARQVIEDREK